MNKAILTINNVSMKYGKQFVLNNINLSVDKGEFISLLGPSGCGKSTLLRLVAGLEKPATGFIFKQGIDITDKTPFERNIGIIFQDYRLIKEKTVYENVELALRVVGENPKNIRPKVMEVLERVGVAHKYKKYPDELSGGECQRVGIARAIVNNPSIIIADECTGNLDIDNSRSIMKLLDGINKQGITVIMATHNLDLVKEFPRRIVKIEGGKIIYDTKRCE